MYLLFFFPFLGGLMLQSVTFVCLIFMTGFCNSICVFFIAEIIGTELKFFLFGGKEFPHPVSGQVAS